jgi:hypothetical protein
VSTLTCLLSLTRCWQGVGDGKQVSATVPTFNAIPSNRRLMEHLVVARFENRRGD